MVAVAVLLAGSVTAREAERWFSVRDDPMFADAGRQLQVLVDAGGHAQINHICVIGQQVGTDRQAYVYWPDDKKLILWEPQIDNPRAILGARRFLDLGKDVAENNDVKGSTYRVTRRFVDATLRACRRFGSQFVLRRAVETESDG